MSNKKNYSFTISSPFAAECLNIIRKSSLKQTILTLSFALPVSDESIRRGSHVNFTLQKSFPASVENFLGTSSLPSAIFTLLYWNIKSE